MRIAQINMIPYGSTGKIMLQIATTAREQGMEARSYTTDLFSIGGKKPRVVAEDLYYYGSFYENMIHNYLGKLLGRNGHYSYFGTQQLIKMLKEFSPDIVHLHNLHCNCIHLPSLFKYLQKNKIKVVWTLHDCWTFTGHCPHFVGVNCEKWKTECHHCPQLRGYPKSYVDTSKQMYRKKKQWFTSIEDMTLVTPSEWLAGLVKQSYFKNYPVKVINNGINPSVFQPTESDFRERYQCTGKKIVLGVASGWGEKKGLDVFVELSKRLPENYQIVLVGTSELTDATLPKNIISIHNTQNQAELAEIYSAADVFANPTREDTYPTVNMEAIACGTPVVTFRVCGSAEMLDPTCGSVIEKNDVDAMEREILRVCEERPYTKEACLAKAKSFDMSLKFGEYVSLYKEISER